MSERKKTTARTLGEAFRILAGEGFDRVAYRGRFTETLHELPIDQAAAQFADASLGRGARVDYVDGLGALRRAEVHDGLGGDDVYVVTGPTRDGA